MDARWIELLITQAVPALATLIAAFVGAWSAFRLTDRAHVRQLQNQNAAAANQALFTLLRQYNALKNVKDQLIDPVRNDPGKFINMQALAPLAYATLHPDFDSLSFLLETEQRGLLVDLMLENERFHAAVFAVNERSQLHLEIVQPLLVRAGVREGGQYRLADVEAALGPQFGPHLQRSTDDAMSHVDSSCASLLAFGNYFADEMKKLFPTKKFIKFDAKPAPNPAYMDSLQQTRN